MKKLILSLAALSLATGIAGAIPNPAAVYCTESGYEYENGDCIFPDGSRCNAWQYYCGCEPNGCWPGDFNCDFPCSQLPCKQAGEHVLVSECCEGLSAIPPIYIYDDDCNYNGMTGWTDICSDCGNGICEVWESRCNCPQDCESSEELEVPWGECRIIDDYVEVGSFKVEGCIIVEGPNGHLFSNGSEGSSSIDGDGTDGPGGDEYARLIINGGRVTVQSRFNIGQDHDGRLIVNNGYFSQECCGDDWDDGFKLPDDDGGEHFIIVNDGEVHVHKFEAISGRHSKIELGCNGKITMDECDHGHDREDPFEFEAAGDLYCSSGCAGPIISYVGDGAEAYCVMVPNEAWAPSPEDDAIHQVVGVVLTWKAGKYVGYPPIENGRHFIYFGDDGAAIEAIPAGNTSSEYYRGFKYGNEELSFDPADAALTLDLWKTYFWRIDELNKAPSPPEQVTKGNVWSFTTGCDLDGDINLDCLLNFDDYAMLADDWGVEVLFPDDVTP